MKELSAMERPSMILPLLGFLLLVGVAAVGGWKWRMIRHARKLLRRERLRREALLRDASLLRQSGDYWQRGTGIGQLPILAAGTAAANQLPQVLEGFERAGAASFIGPILLAEPDEASRAACIAAIPPAFQDRLVALSLPLLPGGLLGRTVPEVLALERYWTADLKVAVDRWLNQIRLYAKPVCLLGLISPGGSGPLGWPALQQFKAEYDQADAYVVMVLDHKTERRELNLPPLVQLYSQGSVVRGFLIADNRRTPELFDQALALLLPSTIVSTWVDPKPQAGFNVLADVFRKHRVATLSAWAGWLPIHYLPPWNDALPPVYHTDASFAQVQAQRGIDHVLSDRWRQALPLPAAARPRFVYVISALRPDPDTRTLASRVQGSLALDPDTTLAFASIGHPLTPTTSQAPLVVVSLFPLAVGLDAVTRLALGEPVATSFLEASLAARTPAQPTDVVASGGASNGSVAKTDGLEPAIP
jgi:hypothetical protein